MEKNNYVKKNLLKVNPNVYKHTIQIQVFFNKKYIDSFYCALSLHAGNECKVAGIYMM